MITIDGKFFRDKDFSGVVRVSFDQGALQHIKVEETIHAKDPEGRLKLLKFGIRVDSSSGATTAGVPLHGRAGSG